MYAGLQFIFRTQRSRIQTHVTRQRMDNRLWKEVKIVTLQKFFGTRITKHISPGLTLFLLAPVLGELLSGHQSPLEFFNPLSLIILSLPYGCGALICRELVVRWKKGFISLLLLGAAYGMFEEGIVVRSFFNPTWGELGNLGMYSHVAGITWTYAEVLIHFHVIVSITASVMLAEILYPEQRHESWISNKTLMGCFLALLLWILAGFFMTSYMPSRGLYILAWLSIFGLVWTARHIQIHPPHTVSVPGPWWFWLLGVVNMTIFFFTVFLTPQYGVPPYFVTALFLLALDGGTLWLILRWSGNGFAWDDRHRLFLIAGALSFFIYACIDQDLEKWEGSSIVGILAIVALWQLKRRVFARIGDPGEEALY
ncbi:MAG: hypothetical protein HXS54_15890 [Theionarchaea archaeon]|nr:hypothetical protein [Theionarchaea archaeon]